MKYSKLFGKTVRSPKSDMKIASHKLLYQAGFVRELSAGRYEFLPLGFKVWEKIVKIIDQEMEKINSQRMSIPILQPIEFWEKSNRDKAWGSSLMKITDARGAEFALSATGEGVVTEMVADTQPSYKDLPIIVHQFIIKLRDEMRTRGGLLRVREFVMKDAYSFHTSEEDFMKTYNDFYKAYSNICETLKLPYYPVIADSGALGGDYCHEFQIPCEAGEDQIVKCSNCDYAANIEMAKFKREEVNFDQVVKEQEWIDARWEEGRTIDQMVEFFGQPANTMIKSVVYKVLGTDKLVIGIVTGDLDVNSVKLAKAAGVDELEKAEEEDLDSIGATSGAVHAWGYEEHKDRITFVVDESIVKAKNLNGGFKTETNDPINTNYGRDFKADIEGDIAEPHEGAICVQCGGKLDLIRTVEFGHVFKYDHFYTQHHDGYYVDENGEKKLMYMGAYGIGIGRAMATIVEKHHDEKGIIWPESVSPYKVHLVALNLENEEVNSQAEKLYVDLLEKGIEVLYDDRIDTSAGQKFNDADLIGIPFRVVISARTNGEVELKKRDCKESENISIEELYNRLT